MTLTAVVLGAGEGTRLRPHTLDRPKCMVRLADRPLLLHIVDSLHRAGVDDIRVVTGYRAEQIEKLGLPTFHNPDYDRTNMVVSLMAAAEVLESGADVIVSYADIVYEPRVAAALIACDAPVSIAVNTAWRELWDLRMEDPLKDAETLKLDAEDNVVELGRKPRSFDDIEGQYMGLIKFRADQAARVGEAYRRLDPKACYDGKDKANMYMTSFLRHWAENYTPIRGVRVRGGWLEVDTSADLELYQRLHADGKLGALLHL